MYSYLTKLQQVKANILPGWLIKSAYVGKERNTSNNTFEETFILFSYQKGNSPIFQNINQKESDNPHQNVGWDRFDVWSYWNKRKLISKIFMERKTSLKCLCTFIYFCLIVFVPGMPSYYTFCIIALAFIFTSLACVFFYKFLNSRPSQQKNILNRILALIMIILLVGISQDFVMSFTACFFRPELTYLVDTYPGLTLFLLSSRNLNIVGLTALLCLSAGRLLLFAKPVIFINLKSYTGIIMTVCISIILVIVDNAYRIVDCKEEEYKLNMLMKLFRAKLGISKNTLANHTANQQNHTLGMIEEENGKCSNLPVIKIEVACFLILEAAKFVYLLAKKIIKSRIKSKVSPTLVLFSTIELPKRVAHPIIQRSESLPMTPVLFLQNQRRSSLPSELQDQRKHKTILKKNLTAVNKLDIHKTDEENWKKNLGKITSLRTSSVFTMFVIICLLVLINDSITNDGTSELSVKAHILTERLLLYLVVILVSVLTIFQTFELFNIFLNEFFFLEKILVIYWVFESSTSRSLVLL